VQKMTLLILLSIVLGPFSLAGFIAAGPTVHRCKTACKTFQIPGLNSVQ
jgi:hypothetical protein